MQHLNINRSEIHPVPPANPIGDGHNDERHNDSEIADDDDDFLDPFQLKFPKFGVSLLRNRL